MCGRTAQTYQAVTIAARALGVPEGSLPKEPPPSTPAASAQEGGQQPESIDDDLGGDPPQHQQQHYEWRDNYNLSPGMDAHVIVSDGSQLRCELKRWGLIPRGGTAAVPLDTSNMMANHFALRMFNARTDTLLEKPTFAHLMNMGKTCVVAFDGFFEWKESNQLAKNKKQPYYVHRHPYLLMAGLHTRVPTGQHDVDNAPQFLDTFTILTTDISPTLKWLHTRMPVFLNDESAKLWLAEPKREGGKHWTPRHQSQMVAQLEQVARHDVEVQWHPVTPQMSSLKFRSIESIQPIQEPKSISSFFASASASASSPMKGASSSAPQKRRRGDDDKAAADDTTDDKGDDNHGGSGPAAAVVSSQSQPQSVHDDRAAAEDDEAKTGARIPAAAVSAKAEASATPTMKTTVAPKSHSVSSKKPKPEPGAAVPTAQSPSPPPKQKTIRSFFSPKSAP
jgi:putative SOS response-associated peptidase YedK